MLVLKTFYDNKSKSNHIKMAINHENLTEVSSLYPISSYEQVFISIGYYTISIMSVFGNAFIILAIMLNASMHNVTNYFITNLAVVDIIISVFSTPFQVGLQIVLDPVKWVINKGICF